MDVFDEDVMFQEAAQSLDGGESGAGNDGGNEGNNDGGGMPPAGETGTDTDNANTPPATATAPTDNAATPPATSPATPPAAAPAPINYEEISGGLIKGVDDITRIATEHRTLLGEIADLREKVARDPFANEFVKTLNQMQVDGKSADQVKAFMQLQELGDISKLPPIEAMIQAKVLRDGRNADLARKQIERKYGITENMDPLDKEIAEADMADDAKADYEYLQSHKKELATPLAPAAPVQAAAALSQEVIRGQVSPIKEKVKEQYNTLGQINLNGKIDDDGKPTADAVLFDLPIPNDFRDKIPALLDDFFVNQGVPVTQENLKTAMGVINYELFNQYGVKLIQDACNAYGSEVEKRIRGEYENKGDFKKKNIAQPNATNLEDSFLEQYVNGD